MNIEDGERIFGKRWTVWTDEERSEFTKMLIYMNLQCMDLGQLLEAYEKLIGIDVESRVVVQNKRAAGG